MEKINFLNSIQKWKKSPDTQPLGAYCAMGDFIQLNEFNDVDFRRAQKKPSIDKNRYSVYVHERQHYLDQISTLWGKNKRIKYTRLMMLLLRITKTYFTSLKHLN